LEDQRNEHRNLIPLLIIAAISGCGPQGHAPAPTPLDADVVLGKSLEIVAEEGLCRLRVAEDGDAKLLPLRLKPPCRLVRNPDAQIPVYRHPDQPGLKVVAIVGTPAAPDPLDPLLQRDNCTASAQALLFESGQVRVSERLAHGLINCPGMELDEKDYWLFAESAGGTEPGPCCVRARRG